MKIYNFGLLVIFFGVIVLILSMRNSTNNQTSSTTEMHANHKKGNLDSPALETAIFAGGCFWCMEGPFEKLDGVTSVISGYTGGRKVHPTYEEVSAGLTEHAEAVEVRYNPQKVSYEKLLYVFWRSIDPTQVDGQFADRGRQYRTAIFYKNRDQNRLAQISKKELEELKKFNQPIVTEITPASEFYPAEEYHQDYYKKNPGHYKAYRRGSGREGFLRKTWGDEAQ